MNAELWSRVGGLFTAIAERPRSAWPGLLDIFCRGDGPEVRYEVERLLRAEPGAGGLLDAPLFRLGESLPPTAIGTAPVSRVGPYRLLRPIGRGATSEVYLAIRDDDDYRRQVAVKLIRAGLEERSVLRRFLAERQILASLDHPHIARLYGGGTADDGRPYLAMEYVDGIPITEYCDRRGLDVEARLRLFLEVCSAVQHAHQSLLVHRDLKPGNILVTAAGETKLLDFGIAKTLAPREGLERRTTQTGRRPMTPGYASPEQVRGDVITTASDVYSLGVLLFELLTSERPYRLDNELPHELERAICEQEVAAPSTSFGRRHEGRRRGERERAAQRRGASSNELRRRLSGDLDTIVARALSKEPARRYGSARQLGSDLERHLTDLPIVARQDHLGYRLGKFVRRNRSSLAAGLGALVLVGGLLSVLRRQHDLIERARTRSERVSDLLVERLAGGEPFEETVDAPVPREALDLSVRQVRGRMLDNPAALAEMLETMGGVYRQAGLTEDALWLLEQSLDVRRRTPGEDDLAVASSLHGLGILLLQAGDLERGAMRLTEALDLRRRRSGGATWALAESLEALGKHAWRMGALAEAEPLLVESLRVREQICPDSAWTARGLSDLGGFRLEQQRLAEAAPLQERAAAIRMRLSANHFDAPRSLEDRALFHLARGEPRQAENLFGQAVEARSLVGRSHETLATALIWRARALIPLGRYSEAVETLRRALMVRRRLDLGGGPDQADLLKHLGLALAGDGEPDAGEALLRRVIERESAWLKPDHPRAAITRGMLAEVLHERGELEGAEELYLRAAHDLAAHPEWEFGAGSQPRLGLARLLLERGHTATAETAARRALELLRWGHPEGHWRIAQAGSLLGSALASGGHAPESEPLLSGGLETLERRLGPAAPRSRRAADRMARAAAERATGPTQARPVAGGAPG